MNKKIISLGLVLFFLFGIYIFKITAQIPEEMKNKIVINKEDSPFGVLEFLPWNHPWNNYKYPDEESLEKVVKLMKLAGVSWVRMDFLWDEIEPEPDKFVFEKYDKIVDLLCKNNIEILGILGYSAIWASSQGTWNSCPKDNQKFVNYAVKVTKHYKDKIKFWEIWNEPDSRIYWIEQDGLKRYCALLKDVYLGIKKVVPDCKILNGGLSAGLASVNRIYDNGVGDYFDILNLHIFESPLNPAALKSVSSYVQLAYKIMLRNGNGHKKIWITEIGSPGVKRGFKVNPWWLGKNPTEFQQAKWLKDVYTMLLNEPQVEKIFWAFFRDCKEHWNNGIDYFGLIRWDFTKKPAFFAYQRCVNAWERKKIKN